MSYSASCAGRSASAMRAAVEACGELARRASSVRLATVMRRGWLRREVGRAQLDHLARADEQHALVGAGSAKMRAASFTAAAAIDTIARRSRSSSALPWRPRTCAGTACCSAVPSVPALLGRAHRLLHLAEDLRLAEHHRVEARGDAERVARDRRSFEHVGVRAQGRGLHSAHPGEPVRAPDRARSTAHRRRPRCGCRSRRSRLPRPVRGVRGTP